MSSFADRFSSSILGVLSGFDRLVFRGHVRSLLYEKGLCSWLSHSNVKLKDFKDWSLSLTERIKGDFSAEAERLGHEVEYLAKSSVKKESLARERQEERKISEGPVASFSCVEPCRRWTIHRNREKKMLEPLMTPGQCMHLYRYFDHPMFGFMHVRLQTWLPFSIQICMNGREFLRRSMERNGIRFEMKDNCFSQIEDWNKAQLLFNEMLNLDWITELNRLTDTVFPSRHSFMDQREYRWSVFQSEWATDYAFENTKAIDDIYPFFLRHAMTCTDIATIGRFLGRPITTTGNLRQNESHEITGRLKRRDEGVCVNFHVGSNGVKFYNKQGSVFRTETTINDPSDFKVFRGTEGQTLKKEWQKLRKSVVDLNRRSQVSQTINDRVLNHLATATITKPLGDNIAQSTKAITWKGNRHRGLDLVGKDRGIIELIAEIGRSVDGIRNKHIKEHLRKTTRGKKTEKQLTGMATRYIRLLRAHGIIKKETKANRYSLTPTGMQVVIAIRSALAASTEKLINLAA